MNAGSTDDKPNLRSIASLAGVSHMTVSRVLNDHPNIRPETREKVLRVVEELNYQRNSAARALATRKSRRIGVIVDRPVEIGPDSTLRAVEHAAREAGYSVSSVAASPDDDGVRPREAVAYLTAHGIDALCVIAPRASSVDVLRELTDGMPTLIVKADDDANFLTASVDQRLGATLAVQHLMDLGHREIVHVAGPLDWLDARARERGWHAHLKKAGLHIPPAFVGNWSADSGYEFAVAFDELPPFTAIFAANDQMALGILHGFRDRGIRVPEDVSVVGFDDLSVSRHFLPTLTTVRQDFHALGTLAVEILVAAVEGRSTERRSRIAPELIVRESTAGPRTM
ncbi:LacI family DNA-binding transcriptional regulator [Jiangella alkaliphila]|uniref:DNA-binding transcriptional regulator, LacI/PurR family n=1 Tax=Jiangella alkaliphila TaxID=419479 RepID=A0A1H2LVM1_9ACTN|nr:LacI family DNA-binding transcriptional regulator [Jiangella alkaliphila]SDU84924.1 DNA-binding transcriptional regulator, LacI/PurR family [Jiangella alkaliphila]